jgi:hypothetical protein
MLLTALLLLATTDSPGPPREAEAADPLAGVRVSARLEAKTLEAGAEARLIIELDAGQAAVDGAGIPAPILQLDVPPSVKLEGRHLKTFAELARNEFLQEPFERLVKEFPAEVRFKLESVPAEGETIGINLIGYLKTEAGDAFLRRRLELPISAGLAGAVARVVSPEDSTWGDRATKDDDALLDIGDRAALFDLPRADGSRVRLEQFLGDKTIIVTTYRAHW